MIDLLKLLEIYLNRKDKFKKIEERSERRVTYFAEISDINNDTDMTDHQKKVLKNSAAQKLAGSLLVDFELVDYFSKHPDFNNFDVIAPLVAFWDETLIKTYDENLVLIKLELDPKAHRKEKKNIKLSICFFAFASVYFFMTSNSIIKYISTNFYISETVLGLFFALILLIITGLIFFFSTLHMALADLKRLVK